MIGRSDDSMDGDSQKIVRDRSSFFAVRAFFSGIFCRGEKVAQLERINDSLVQSATKIARELAETASLNAELYSYCEDLQRERNDLARQCNVAYAALIDIANRTCVNENGTYPDVDMQHRAHRAITELPI